MFKLSENVSQIATLSSFSSVGRQSAPSLQIKWGYVVSHMMKDVHEHRCNLLGTHFPHAMKTQLEEVMREKDNEDEKTRNMDGNILLRERRGSPTDDDERKHEEELEPGGEEGKV